MTTATSPMADITLVNLNMLYVRYVDQIDREYHVPLGPLYLIAALEQAGLAVDFRDYQLVDNADPFTPEAIAAFLADPAPVLGVSCMANLLPFSILALRDFKARHPQVTVILGGVGAFAVERKVLERFDWIDVVAYGEGERSAPRLISALKDGGDLSRVPGIFWRRGEEIVRNPPPERIPDPGSLPPPAYHHIDLARYDGYGIITSRGCPYPCTFCSVAPVWNRQTTFRSNQSILEEMRTLHERTGADLFLFQDEFFVSGKDRVLSFCEDFGRMGLPVEWKAFGRVNLTDVETMRAMAEADCVEIRYGIESASDRVLERTKKGFTSAEAAAVVTAAVEFFPRVDSFYVWGFPFETMDDFHQSVFQMVSLRLLGSRILPSLLCFLPQTDIYGEYAGSERFVFCRELFPEYMLTGHEQTRSLRCRIEERHRPIFDFIEQHPDLFCGFFHYDLESNVLPKLEVLQHFDFYAADGPDPPETESCGAHSPRRLADLATRS